MEVGGLHGGRAEAARINARADHVVIPLANAFRPSYAENLDRMSETIERLRVPVTILGVGAQLRLDGKVDRLNGMKDSVVRFVRAVLDRSPSIGVRGEFTEQYLKGLGFSDVEVSAAPRSSSAVRTCSVEKRVAALLARSRISLNLSRTCRASARSSSGTRSATRTSATRRSTATRSGCCSADGTAARPTRRTSRCCRRTTRTRSSATAAPASSSTPSRGCATSPTSTSASAPGSTATSPRSSPGRPPPCSRTTPARWSSSRYYDIPHRTMKQVGPDTDAAELYAEADFTAFNARPRRAVRPVRRLPRRARAAPRLRGGRGPHALRPPRRRGVWPGDVGRRREAKLATRGSRDALAPRQPAPPRRGLTGPSAVLPHPAERDAGRDEPDDGPGEQDQRGRAEVPGALLLGRRRSARAGTPTACPARPTSRGRRSPRSAASSAGP